MARMRRWVAASIAVLAGLGLSRVARADEEPVTVVDVAPSAAELDAGKLRTSIAGELHSRVVAPDDPLAASAQGTLRIELDHATAKLTVTYVARRAPITRTIPLSVESAVARSQAVLLAGNLARDEASELTSELRDRRPPVSKGDTPLPPAPSENKAPSREIIDEQRLQATLVYYALQARRSRIALGWTLTAAGVAAGAAGFYFARTGDPGEVNSLFFGLAPALLVSGIVGLASTTSFENLAATSLRGSGPLTTSEEWVHAAQSEHSTRHGIAGLELFASGLTLAAGTFFLANKSLTPDAESRADIASSFYVAGLLVGVVSVYALTTDGPVETALHAYERSTGQTLVPQDALLDHLNVALGPHGASGGFRMTF
jgi:hypothetical protein